jgi:predicted MFS family arabinose efflux permease
MPRFRTVVITAAAAAVLLVVWLSLPGCNRREQNLEQQLEKERQERQTAEFQARAWQVRAVVLGSAAVLTLIVGTALGSRARHDARRNRPHEPQE